MGAAGRPLPQQRLYFRPEPQAQRELRLGDVSCPLPDGRGSRLGGPLEDVSCPLPDGRGSLLGEPLEDASCPLPDGRGSLLGTASGSLIGMYGRHKSTESDTFVVRPGGWGSEVGYGVARAEA